jgi:hypothetical protein
MFVIERENITINEKDNLTVESYLNFVRNHLNVKRSESFLLSEIIESAGIQVQDWIFRLKEIK